jgi:hypothetical protein
MRGDKERGDKEKGRQGEAYMRGDKARHI